MNITLSDSLSYVSSLTTKNRFTETSPFVGIDDAGLGDQSGPIGWDSIPILIMYLYKEYGDISIVREAYDATKRWIDFLGNASIAQVESGLSDWMNVETGGNVRRLTGQVFLYMNFQSFSEMALLVGDNASAMKYAKNAQDTKQYLNAQFLNADGTYTDNSTFNLTQCGQSMPLFRNLVPETLRDSVVSKLYESLGTPKHLLVGMFCMEPLLSSLNVSTAYDIAVTRSTYPSFGNMLLQNATTVWESWFYSNNTFSHNHPMFGGGLVSWMIRDLAGIRQLNWSIGYSHIWFRPRSPCTIPKNDTFDGIEVMLNSPIRGNISSSWSQSEKTFEFLVPPGSVADVDLPDRDTYSVGPGSFTVNDVVWCV